MMARPRLVCITDVPTPYRNHLFDALHAELRRRQILFEVWFMAAAAPDRFWAFGERLGDYQYRIWRGLHPAWNGWAYHVNPGMAASLVASPPTWILMGGAWNQPSVVLSAIAARLRGRSTILFWSEANRESSTIHQGGIARLRRRVLGLADAFAVPGSIAETTIRDHWRVDGKPFVALPNVVDDRIYAAVSRHPEDRPARRAGLGLPAGARVFLWPARLHESTKGILNFLNAVRPLFTGREIIVIAGEGPDRPAIERWISAHPGAGVRLVGHQTQAQMVNWLGVADVLLLPSLRDPNPLAVVEGLWAGLPLFISRKCGNHPEAVEPGTNGWVVDPEDGGSIAAAFAAALSAPSDVLSRMGEASRRIAAERFATGPSVVRFADALLGMGSAPHLPLSSCGIPL